jgi:hypothetical protein
MRHILEQVRLRQNERGPRISCNHIHPTWYDLTGTNILQRSWYRVLGKLLYDLNSHGRSRYLTNQSELTSVSAAVTPRYSALRKRHVEAMLVAFHPEKKKQNAILYFPGRYPRNNVTVFTPNISDKPFSPRKTTGARMSASSRRVCLRHPERARYLLLNHLDRRAAHRARRQHLLRDFKKRFAAQRVVSATRGGRGPFSCLFGLSDV